MIGSKIEYARQKIVNEGVKRRGKYVTLPTYELEPKDSFTGVGIFLGFTTETNEDGNLVTMVLIKDLEGYIIKAFTENVKFK